MEIRTLKYFVTIAQLESFSRAAESLFVTQSSLSKQIASLEKELGTSLFVRHGRTISLTPAGESLLEGAVKLIEDEERLSAYVTTVGEKTPAYNKLIIQMRDPVSDNMDFCKYLGETALEFKEKYPSIRFEFRYDNSPAPIMNLSTADADIYVCMATEVRSDDEMNIMVLNEDPFVLVGSKRLIPDPDHVNYIDLLSRYPLAIATEGNALLDISQVLGELGVQPNMYYTDGLFGQLMSLCSEDSIALIPKNSVHRILTEGLSVAPLPEDIPTVSLFLFYRKNFLNPLVPQFVESLSDRIQNQ